MKAPSAIAFLMAFWAASSSVASGGEEARAAVRQLHVDNYATILAECNIAVYSILRYVTVDANGADSKQLKSLAHGLAKRIKEFKVKFQTLQGVTPIAPELQPTHRLFLKSIGELEPWSDKLLSAFKAGASDETMRQVAIGKYLLRDLSEAHHAVMKDAQELEPEPSVRESVAEK